MRSFLFLADHFNLKTWFNVILPRTFHIQIQEDGSTKLPLFKSNYSSCGGGWEGRQDILLYWSSVSKIVNICWIPSILWGQCHIREVDTKTMEVKYFAWCVSEVTFGLGSLIAKPEFFLDVCTLGLFDLVSEYLCGSRCGPQEVQTLSPEKAAGHQPHFIAVWHHGFSYNTVEESSIFTQLSTKS